MAMTKDQPPNVWKPIAIVFAVLLVIVLVFAVLVVAGLMDLGFSLL
jgi:hypothetical protein